MGMLLFGGYISLPIIITCYLFAVFISLGKRLREKRRKQVGRRTVGKYSFFVANSIAVSTLLVSTVLLRFTPYPYKYISLLIVCVQSLCFYGFYSQNKHVTSYYKYAARLYDY